jgi:hypothetical protein
MVLENPAGLQQPMLYLVIVRYFGIFASFSPSWVRGLAILSLKISKGRIPSSKESSI